MIVDGNVGDLAFYLGAPAAASIVTVAVILYLQKPKNGDTKISGNGQVIEDRGREMGVITAELRHLAASVNELKVAASENQERISELSGNLNALTNLMSRHFKI